MTENCSECIYMENGKCKLKPAACLNYDHFQWSPMIQISVSDFEEKYISRLAFDEMKARAEKAEARLAELARPYTIQPSETTNWSAEDIIRREGG